MGEINNTNPIKSEMNSDQTSTKDLGMEGSNQSGDSSNPSEPKDYLTSNTDNTETKDHVDQHKKDIPKKSCYELLKEVKQLVTLIEEDNTKDELNTRIDSLSNEFKTLKKDVSDNYKTTKNDIIDLFEKHINSIFGSCSDEMNKRQSETKCYVDNAIEKSVSPLSRTINDLARRCTNQIDDLSNKIKPTSDNIFTKLLELEKNQQKIIENLNLTIRKEEIEGLFTEIKQLVLKNNQEKDDALSELRKELETVNAKVDNLSNDCQKTIDSLRKELDSRKDEYEKNLKKLEEDERNLTILKDKEKEDELTSLRNQLEDEKKKAIEELEKAHKSQNEELQSAFNEKIELYEKKISELENQTKSLKREMDKDKNEESERNRPFVNLLEKIVKCESMKDFSDNKKLNDICSSYSNSPEKIRDFISLVGNEYGFALDICNALKKFKKASADPKPITQEEKELIEEINKFYREREGRDQNEELLYLPKGFSYSNVSGAKIPFYEPEMQDLKDAMQNRFEYISDVYTPCFKKYGTMNPQIKATVKGRIKG